MVDETKIAPQSEEEKQPDNAPEVEKKQTETSAPQDVKEEETIGEALKLPSQKSAGQERLVPQAALMEWQKIAREQKKELRELKEAIEKGATKKQVSKSLERLAAEHNIDLNFLDEFAGLIKDEAKSEAKAEMEATVKPIYEREQQERVDQAFNAHWAKVMEAMPQYEDIANPAIIKKLSLLDENRHKTFSKLLEETYGHLLGSRKTLEKARGREKEPEITTIDYKRAGVDTEYFKKIMADPDLKKKYNQNLHMRNTNNVFYKNL